MNKKVKRSVSSITMPDDVKERIIANCQVPGTADEKFADHVSGIEHVRNRSYLKVISGIAACAVLAGTIGVSAHLLRNQPSPAPATTAPESTTIVAGTEPTEPVTESAAPQLDELMERFLSQEYTLFKPDEQLDANGEPLQLECVSFTEEEREEIAGIFRKYQFTEISEEEYQSADQSDEMYFNYQGSSLEGANFNIKRNGFVSVLFETYDTQDNDETSYELTHLEHKYYKCSDGESLFNELLAYAEIPPQIAPFIDFRYSDVKVTDPYREASITTEGNVPLYIDMSEVYKKIWPDVWIDDPLIPTQYTGRALTEDERYSLYDFFEHADYEDVAETDLPEHGSQESINFTHIDDFCKTTISILNDGYLVCEDVGFTWDKTSDTAIADSEHYFRRYYRIDYQQFRDAVTGILGEDIICKAESYSETPPFGHLTDYDLNSYQAYGVDWGQAVPAEAITAVMSYIESHQWTEVSQPIEGAIIDDENSKNSAVILYNSLSEGGVGYSFYFSNGGYVSMLTSDGIETWYKCSEDDDIAAGVDNIIQEYYNNN